MLTHLEAVLTCVKCWNFMMDNSAQYKHTVSREWIVEERLINSD